MGTNRPVEGLGAREVFKWYGHVSDIVPMFELVIVFSLSLGAWAVVFYEDPYFSKPEDSLKELELRNLSP